VIACDGSDRLTAWICRVFWTNGCSCSCALVPVEEEQEEEEEEEEEEAEEVKTGSSAAT
jgi:hypothetical protein